MWIGGGGCICEGVRVFMRAGGMKMSLKGLSLYEISFVYVSFRPTLLHNYSLRSLAQPK